MDSESRYELIPPQLGCSVILRQGHLPLTGVTLYLWARQPAPQPYPPPISQWGPQNFSSPACHGCCGTQGCSLRPPPGVMAVGSGPLGLPIRSQRHRIPPSRVSPVPGWGRGVGAGGEAWCSLPRACHMPLLLSRVPFTPDRRQLPAEPGVTSQAPPASWLFSPCRTNSQHPVPSMKVSGVSVPHAVWARGGFSAMEEAGKAVMLQPAPGPLPLLPLPVLIPPLRLPLSASCGQFSTTDRTPCSGNSRNADPRPIAGL